MARSTSLTGEAGSFLVAAELALRGWPAALTTSGTRRTDLFAQVGQNRLPVAIQVKTKSEPTKDFQPGNVTSPAAPGANEWVVLVGLQSKGTHRFYVVPRDLVVATVLAANLAFSNPSRVLLGAQEYEFYQGRWDLLEVPSSEVPWRAKHWVIKRIPEVWPENYPTSSDIEAYDEAAL